MSAGRIRNDYTKYQALHGSNGTKWRARALVAMGHSAVRIAEATDLNIDTVRQLLRGETGRVTGELRERITGLYEEWWDKTPPRETASQRQAASLALTIAARENWPAPMALDEADPDYDPGHVPAQPAARASLRRHTEIVRVGMDHPEYEPVAVWMPATGRGVAQDRHREAERELEAG